MKILGIATVLSVFMLPTLALADEKLPENIKPMSEVITNLQGNGYDLITEVEFDDGKFVAKAINREGKDIKVEIAPLTGEIIQPRKDKEVTLTILDAVKKVEGAGYHSVYKVKLDDDNYKVKALDAKNKEVSLKVDAKSGKIKD